MNYSDFHLSRVVLELRYTEAFKYWDVCGATNAEIKTSFPEWKWLKTTTELSIFKEIKKRLELVFNINSIRFTQDQVDSLNQLKNAAKEITPIILNKLEIASFSRIGNRYFYIYPVENVEKGLEIIKKNKLVQISEDKIALFGDTATRSNFTVYIRNGDLQFRIELTTIERIDESKDENIDEKFLPKYGLRFDIDFALTSKTLATSFSLEDFVQKNHKFIESNLIKLVR